MLLADGRQHLEALGRRDAGGEGAQRRALDGRAIRQRIGEGDAQLQRVRAGFDQGVDNLQRQRRVRIAQRHERDEGAFLAAFQTREQLLITFHQISPRAFKMS